MKYLTIAIVVLFSFNACSTNKIVKTEQIKKKVETPKVEATEKVTEEKKPEIGAVPNWAKDAVLYEVNVRQFSEEGNFAAVEEAIPRLKEMGVDILWLMPIHPIGIENRKGTEGSYYSVQDYMKVHEDYGTVEDLQRLVKTAQLVDMHVIIDWVANHSAWDNWMVTKHPDWYTLKDGKMVPPVEDWSDVVDLNFDNKEFRAYMKEAMQYWVNSVGINGFRCDVAEMVPLNFWKETIDELSKIRPLFMLAEAENPELHQVGFHATYSWELHHLLNQIAQGKIDVNAIREYLAKNDARFNKADYRLNFTSNHDENSWNGSVFERMGEAHKCLAALTYALPGMPLIYSGQEAPMKEKLAFFEKDPISWNDYSYARFYQELNELKHKHQSLWNGESGGDLVEIETTKPNEVLAFMRVAENDETLFVFNLSNKEVNIEIKDETFTKKTKLNRLSLKPWEYKMY